MASVNNYCRIIMKMMTGCCPNKSRVLLCSRILILRENFGQFKLFQYGIMKGRRGKNRVGCFVLLKLRRGQMISEFVHFLYLY